MRKDLVVREATAEEIPELVDLLLHLDAHVSGARREELELTEEGEEQIRNRLLDFIADPEKLVVVACADGNRIVGMGSIHVWRHPEIWLTPERRGGRSAFIDDFWVDPGFRRRGVTKRILLELVRFAARHGIEELLLEYSLSNEEADATWRRLGFVPTGVRAATSVAGLEARLTASGGRRSS